MTQTGPVNAVTLRALEGTPLQHDAIRTMVEATAHALAERQGVTITDLETTTASITITLAAEEIVAIGFAAELRRLTTSWYCHKFGVDTLWGEAHL